MNLLLDINVVLDVFLSRTEFLGDSAAVLQANHEGRLRAFLSAAFFAHDFLRGAASGGHRSGTPGNCGVLGLV